MSKVRHSNSRASCAYWATLVALLSGFGCSYYSEDVLTSLARGGDGGAGASSSSPASNGADAGTPTRGGGGGTQDSTSSSGSDAISGSSSGARPSGGSESLGGAAPEMASAGAGGEGVDACPDDPKKVDPGQCGCGIPESCGELKAGLAHRYAFDKNGTVASDSIGSAHGSIVGASASSGKIAFDGTAAAYVDLPNGVISSLEDASFEVWLTWGGGATWQRVFDFGTNDLGEGKQGEGSSYVYITPSDGWSGNALRASFSANGVGNETTVRTSAPLATGSLQHLVLVVDDTNNQLRLYLNGNVAAITGFTQSLSSLSDVNNWVGRSNFKDAPLKATVEEFRIYQIALTQDQVAASFGYGPNPSFL
jgi:hypothetical protein